MDQIDEAIRWFTENPAEPHLLEVELDTLTNTYPKLAFGRQFGEMEPLSKSLEMEAT